MSQNRYRTILPGADYKLPPMQDKVNPLKIDGETFIKGIDFNEGKIDAQIVNMLVAVSPSIEKEINTRANLATPQTYMEMFIDFQQQLKSQSYKPTIYRDKKEDFHLLPITSFQGESESFNTTNEMLDHFYSGKAERDRVKQQAGDLSRFIKNEKDKNERKLKNIGKQSRRQREPS